MTPENLKIAYHVIWHFFYNTLSKIPLPYTMCDKREVVHRQMLTLSNTATAEDYMVSNITREIYNIITNSELTRTQYLSYIKFVEEITDLG